VPALVGLPFAATFGFARSVAAPYRNAAGVLVSAPPNLPRYDHLADRTRRGLLIDANGFWGTADILTVHPGDWADVSAATVLIAFVRDGVTYRRAVYATDVRATVNATVNTIGHHLITAAVKGYLPNLGGFVRYRADVWRLGELIDAGTGRVIGDGAGNPVIESA
jgi:hypothetical protein